MPIGLLRRQSASPKSAKAKTQCEDAEGPTNSLASLPSVSARIVAADRDGVNTAATEASLCPGLGAQGDGSKCGSGVSSKNTSMGGACSIGGSCSVGYDSSRYGSSSIGGSSSQGGSCFFGGASHGGNSSMGGSSTAAYSCRDPCHNDLYLVPQANMLAPASPEAATGAQAIPGLNRSSFDLIAANYGGLDSGVPGSDDLLGSVDELLDSILPNPPEPLPPQQVASPRHLSAHDPELAPLNRTEAHLRPAQHALPTTSGSAAAARPQSASVGSQEPPELPTPAACTPKAVAQAAADPARRSCVLYASQDVLPLPAPQGRVGAAVALWDSVASGGATRTLANDPPPSRRSSFGAPSASQEGLLRSSSFSRIPRPPSLQGLSGSGTELGAAGGLSVSPTRLPQRTARSTSLMQHSAGRAVSGSGGAEARRTSPGPGGFTPSTGGSAGRGNPASRTAPGGTVGATPVALGPSPVSTTVARTFSTPPLSTTSRPYTRCVGMPGLFTDPRGRSSLPTAATSPSLSSTPTAPPVPHTRPPFNPYFRSSASTNPTTGVSRSAAAPPGVSSSMPTLAAVASATRQAPASTKSRPPRPTNSSSMAAADRHAKLLRNKPTAEPPPPPGSAVSHRNVGTSPMNSRTTGSEPVPRTVPPSSAPAGNPYARTRSADRPNSRPAQPALGRTASGPMPTTSTALSSKPMTTTAGRTNIGAPSTSLSIPGTAPQSVVTPAPSGHPTPTTTSAAAAAPASAAPGPGDLCSQMRREVCRYSLDSVWSDHAPPTHRDPSPRCPDLWSRQPPGHHGGSPQSPADTLSLLHSPPGRRSPSLLSPTAAQLLPPLPHGSDDPMPMASPDPAVCGLEQEGACAAASIVVAASRRRHRAADWHWLAHAPGLSQTAEDDGAVTSRAAQEMEVVSSRGVGALQHGESEDSDSSFGLPAWAWRSVAVLLSSDGSAGRTERRQPLRRYLPYAARSQVLQADAEDDVSLLPLRRMLSTPRQRRPCPAYEGTALLPGAAGDGVRPDPARASDGRHAGDLQRGLQQEQHSSDGGPATVLFKRQTARGRYPSRRKARSSDGANEQQVDMAASSLPSLHSSFSDEPAAPLAAPEDTSDGGRAVDNGVGVPLLPLSARDVDAMVMESLCLSANAMSGMWQAPDGLLAAEFPAAVRRDVLEEDGPAAVMEAGVTERELLQPEASGSFGAQSLASSGSHDCRRGAEAADVFCDEAPSRDTPPSQRYLGCDKLSRVEGSVDVEAASSGTSPSSTDAQCTVHPVMAGLRTSQDPGQQPDGSDSDSDGSSVPRRLPAACAEPAFPSPARLQAPTDQQQTAASSIKAIALLPDVEPMGAAEQGASSSSAPRVCGKRTHMEAPSSVVRRRPSLERLDGTLAKALEALRASGATPTAVSTTRPLDRSSRWQDRATSATPPGAGRDPAEGPAEASGASPGRSHLQPTQLALQLLSAAGDGSPPPDGAVGVELSWPTAAAKEGDEDAGVGALRTVQPVASPPSPDTPCSRGTAPSGLSAMMTLMGAAAAGARSGADVLSRATTEPTIVEAGIGPVAVSRPSREALVAAAAAAACSSIPGFMAAKSAGRAAPSASGLSSAAVAGVAGVTAIAALAASRAIGSHELLPGGSPDRLQDLELPRQSSFMSSGQGALPSEDVSSSCRSGASSVSETEQQAGPSCDSSPHAVGTLVTLNRETGVARPCTQAPADPKAPGDHDHEHRRKRVLGIASSAAEACAEAVAALRASGCDPAALRRLARAYGVIAGMQLAEAGAVGALPATSAGWSDLQSIIRQRLSRPLAAAISSLPASSATTAAAEPSGQLQVPELAPTLAGSSSESQLSQLPVSPGRVHEAAQLQEAWSAVSDAAGCASRLHIHGEAAMQAALERLLQTVSALRFAAAVAAADSATSIAAATSEGVACCSLLLRLRKTALAAMSAAAQTDADATRPHGVAFEGEGEAPELRARRRAVLAAVCLAVEPTGAEAVGHAALAEEEALQALSQSRALHQAAYARAQAGAAGTASRADLAESDALELLAHRRRKDLEEVVEAASQWAGAAACAYEQEELAQELLLDTGQALLQACFYGEGAAEAAAAGRAWAGEEEAEEALVVSRHIALVLHCEDVAADAAVSVQAANAADAAISALDAFRQLRLMLVEVTSGQSAATAMAAACGVDQAAAALALERQSVLVQVSKASGRWSAMHQCGAAAMQAAHLELVHDRQSMLQAVVRIAAVGSAVAIAAGAAEHQACRALEAQLRAGALAAEMSEAQESAALVLRAQAAEGEALQVLVKRRTVLIGVCLAVEAAEAAATSRAHVAEVEALRAFAKQRVAHRAASVRAIARTACLTTQAAAAESHALELLALRRQGDLAAVAAATASGAAAAPWAAEGEELALQHLAAERASLLTEGFELEAAAAADAVRAVRCSQEAVGALVEFRRRQLHRWAQIVAKGAAEVVRAQAAEADAIINWTARRHRQAVVVLADAVLGGPVRWCVIAAMPLQQQLQICLRAVTLGTGLAMLAAAAQTFAVCYSSSNIRNRSRYSSITVDRPTADFAWDGPQDKLPASSNPDWPQQPKPGFLGHDGGSLARPVPIRNFPVLPVGRKRGEAASGRRQLWMFQSVQGSLRGALFGNKEGSKARVAGGEAHVDADAGVRQSLDQARRMLGNLNARKTVHAVRSYRVQRVQQARDVC